VKGVFICALVALIAGCAPRDTRDAPASGEIAAARAVGNGTVRVAGTVTVASGTFDEGFALQDASGGVYIVNSPGGPYVPGERVEVDGNVTRKEGGIVIAPGAVRRIGAATVPAAARIDVSGFRPGEPLTATGLGARYEQHFEILPRQASDLHGVKD
jgi:hypothetical protein